MSDAKRPNEQVARCGRQPVAFAPAQFGDLPQARPAQQPKRPRRGHDLGAFAKAVKRPGVEMIEVRVREEDEIDRRQLAKLQRRLRQAFRSDRKSGQTNSAAREKNRIGQDGDAEEIEQDCGMPEPGRGQAVVRPSVWLRPGESGLDWPAELEEPLVPEMRDPVTSRRRFGFLRQDERNFPGLSCERARDYSAILKIL